MEQRIILVGAAERRFNDGNLIATPKTAPKQSDRRVHQPLFFYEVPQLWQLIRPLPKANLEGEKYNCTLYTLGITLFLAKYYHAKGHYPLQPQCPLLQIQRTLTMSRPF